MAAIISFLMMDAVCQLVLLAQSQPFNTALQQRPLWRRDVVMLPTTDVVMLPTTEGLTDESSEASHNSDKKCQVTKQQRRHVFNYDEEDESVNSEKENNEGKVSSKATDQDGDTNEERGVRSRLLWATQWPNTIQSTDTELQDGGSEREEFVMERKEREVHEEKLNLADMEMYEEVSRGIRSQSNGSGGIAKEDNPEEFSLLESDFAVVEDSIYVEESSRTDNEDVADETKLTEMETNGDDTINLRNRDFDDINSSSSEETIVAAIEEKNSSSKQEANIIPSNSQNLREGARSEGSPGEDELFIPLAFRRDKRQQMGFLHLGSPPPHAIRGPTPSLSKLFDTDPDKPIQR